MDYTFLLRSSGFAKINKQSGIKRKGGKNNFATRFQFLEIFKNDQCLSLKLFLFGLKLSLLPPPSGFGSASLTNDGLTFKFSFI